MEIKSKFFGTQSIDPDTIITFPQGIPGFESDTQFKLFHQEGSEIVYWLQSVQNEELVFSVAQPMNFNINYHFSLTDAEEKLLAVNRSEDLLLLIMLHKNEEESAQPTIKGSIKSPLVINTQTRIGIQKILAEVEQSITLTETSSEVNLSEA